MRIVFLMCLIGVTTFIVGCGEEKNWPARGKVLLDGKPLPGALVEFVVPGTNRCAVSRERTNAAGEFVLVQGMSTDGCKVGEYRVSITTVKEDLDEETGEPIIIVLEKVPDRYNRESTLTRTIEPKDDNFFEFDLKTETVDE